MFKSFSISRLLMAGTALTVVFAGSALAQNAGKETTNGKAPISVIHAPVQTAPSYPQVTGDPVKDKAFFEMRKQNPTLPYSEIVNMQMPVQNKQVAAEPVENMEMPARPDASKPNPMGVNLQVPVPTVDVPVKQAAVKPTKATAMAIPAIPGPPAINPNVANPLGLNPATQVSGGVDQAKAAIENALPKPVQPTQK